MTSEGWGAEEVEEEEDGDEAASRTKAAASASGRQGAESDAPRRRDLAQEWRAASNRVHVGALKKLVERADALAEEAEIEAAAAADEGEEPDVEEARERRTQAEAAKADADASRSFFLAKFFFSLA